MTITPESTHAEPTGTPIPNEPAGTDTPDLQRRRFHLPLIGYLTLLPAVVLVIVAIIGPWIIPYSATEVVAKPDLSPGTDGHWFGTDSAGMDVFSRTVAATQNNLLIGVLTTLAATGVGVLLGLLVGMNESRSGPIGWLSRGVSRAIDLIQAIPAIIIGLVLIAFFGATIPSLVFALSVILMPNQARLVRTEVLRVRGEAYLDAARISGESEFAVILRHVLPNSSWPALENASLVFGSAIILSAGLGFLGVGLNPPTPEWGSMIAAGAPAAAVGRWWPAMFPAIALALTVFAVTAVGQRFFNDER
ncbi:ABC transporter permease [Williamsia sp. 1135]|uniref:ABC transporter permease n=1 Tax=Williamsia sp. 1135 TaxID=1889262 RepID=UPI000A1093D5|nr:ABC transporter permease [Williamsia sp. 1135]ORM34072.1 peptide ABC transporter [Williamsia sp. 1135]